MHQLIRFRRFIFAAAVMALVAVAAVIIAGAEVRTTNWPQFRGSQAGVAADDPALPETWSDTENVAWKTEIPGVGWSSPVVWGDHIFVTSAVNTAESDRPKAREYTAREVAPTAAAHRWMVYDLDFSTGAIRWQREVGSAVPNQPRHLKNSYASETPATDGQRVYAYFGSIGLFAFDMNGKPVWSKPIGPFKMRQGWGAAASPIVYQNQVYLVNDNEEQSFLVAYDAATGAERWRVKRHEGSNWSTPYIWENSVRTELVTTGSTRVRSYDLSGALLWEMAGLSTLHIPTPFARNGLLYLNSGFRVDAKRPVYAIRPGASGDISLKADQTTNQFVAWSNPTLGSYNPSSLAYGDYYYTLFDTSFLACNDARTGKEVYPKTRISADSTGFTASPWAYNGKIFALSEDGDTFVIEPGPQFKIIGRNSLNEMTLATPAVANGSLVVRTASKLYRIRRPLQ
jgi:outer membrane protein assembly factor BamB